MLPATISRLDNWTGLVEFMAQKYQVFFFELPGHGQSTPFPRPFDWQQMIQTVEEFSQALRLNNPGLMGFSFGSLLALQLVKARPELFSHLILVSPNLGWLNLNYSPAKSFGLKQLVYLLTNPAVSRLIFYTIKQPTTRGFWLSLLKSWGQLEIYSDFNSKLDQLTETTYQVLIRQIRLIASTSLADYPVLHLPVFMAMSRADPLLNYQVTCQFISQHFPDQLIITLNLPYHQPPEPLTLSYLNQHYGRFLQKLPYTKT